MMMSSTGGGSLSRERGSLVGKKARLRVGFGVEALGGRGVEVGDGMVYQTERRYGNTDWDFSLRTLNPFLLSAVNHMNPQNLHSSGVDVHRAQLGSQTRFFLVMMMIQPQTSQAKHYNKSLAFMSRSP